MSHWDTQQTFQYLIETETQQTPVELTYVPGVHAEHAEAPAVRKCASHTPIFLPPQNLGLVCKHLLVTTSHLSTMIPISQFHVQRTLVYF